VHILTSGQASLDLDALRRIREKVEVSLVVHGGTSLPPESIAELINLGVAKLNYGTVLKQVYLAVLQESLPRYHPPMSPHPFLGMGGSLDILAAARAALKTKVKELLLVSKSAGQARAA
jgi:fructose/tagatose bisphosphate aldolase